MWPVGRTNPELGPDHKTVKITSKEDRHKLSPMELYAWDLLTCLKKSRRGSRMIERLE